MRLCVLAVGMIASAQPALARDFHHSSHHVSHHRHHVAQARHHHRVARLHRNGRFARVRNAAPIESGYSMPQSFARTDAIDMPFAQPAMQPRMAPSSFDTPRAPRLARATPRSGALDAMIARHAAANGLPAALVHRVVIRESRYNPRARNGGALGLMQIKHATARAMGYSGSASGLLDAETNLTYAVRYLAGAYRAAGGNASRAVGLYASGYHGRGVAVARRPVRVVAAQNGVWGQSAPWGMQQAPVAMQGEAFVMRSTRRHRIRLR
jgi:soluble lytic murein transglycosylase-like protein